MMIRLFSVLLGAHLLAVILWRFLPIPITNFMLYKFATETHRIQYRWVPMSKIAKVMQVAVVKSEDDLFWTHHGFDFKAIQKAMKYNKTHKKKKGASTISQQTAKNVFLYPSRSYVRKALEVIATVAIESLWSKERILEVYLNVIEFGPGIYGVEAASNHYFRKSAKELSRDEAALLTAVLPGPMIYSISHPSRYLLKRRGIISARIKKALSPTIQVRPDQDVDLKFDEEAE